MTDAFSDLDNLTYEYRNDLDALEWLADSLLVYVRLRRCGESHIEAGAAANE